MSIKKAAFESYIDNLIQQALKRGFVKCEPTKNKDRIFEVLTKQAKQHNLAISYTSTGICLAKQH